MFCNPTNLFFQQDYKILPQCQPVIDGTVDKVSISMLITNEDRTFGATLSYYISM